MHTIVSWPIYIIYILSWNPKKSLNKAREGNKQNIASSGFYKCICDKSEWWPHFEKKGRKRQQRKRKGGQLRRRWLSSTDKSNYNFDKMSVWVDIDT